MALSMKNQEKERRKLWVFITMDGKNKLNFFSYIFYLFFSTVCFGRDGFVKIFDWKGLQGNLSSSFPIFFLPYFIFIFHISW